MFQNPSNREQQLLNLAERIAIEMRKLKDDLNSRVDANGNVNSADSADEALKLSNPRNISVSGDASGTASFDGSKDVAINITLKSLFSQQNTYGPSKDSDLRFGDVFTVPYITIDVNGRVSTGGSRNFKLPEVPSSVSGNAGSATKLQNPRNIRLTGSISSDPVAFDGSQDIDLNVTKINVDDQLQTVINEIASAIENSFAS